MTDMTKMSYVLFFIVFWWSLCKEVHNEIYQKYAFYDHLRFMEFRSKRGGIGVDIR